MLLTTARLSLWDAIEHWPALQRFPPADTSLLFERTYRLDDESLLLSEIVPSLSDLPALAILPTSVTPAWFTHEMQTWPVLFDVTLWTADWHLPEAESLIEHVIDAVYRSHAEGSSVSYVKQATGFHPQRLGPITFDYTRLGPDRELTAIVTRTLITLRTSKDPFQT